jgi:hypothetical protein
MRLWGASNRTSVARASGRFSEAVQPMWLSKDESMGVLCGRFGWAVTALAF